MNKFLVLILCVLVCACGPEDEEGSPVAYDAEEDAGGDATSDAGIVPVELAQDQAADASVAFVADSSAQAMEEHDAATPPADAGFAQTDGGLTAPRVVTTNTVDVQVESLCNRCHAQWAGIGQTSVKPFLDSGFGRVLGGATPDQQVLSVSSCNHLVYVTPGSIDHSYLYVKLTQASPCGQHAPIDGLTTEKLQLLADWIMSGAGSVAKADGG